jgi:DNA repair exonuclease SbcCD ATPase subunit
LRINFKRVWAKNFRSIDNMGLELIFKPGATMIGSLDNGAGKSTMLLWAIYFALFDKAYGAKSTKTKLINSRSNKDCIVEVEFNTNGSDWKVVRGQKPTIFQIWKDGVEIKDEAALKHHQESLASVIGMDEKAFCNTVALGLDKFVPFVSMSAPDRRNYGEQMLDMVVISVMNEKNKVVLKDLSSQQTALLSSSNTMEFKIKSLKEMIQVKKAHSAEINADIDSQISEVKTEIDKAQAALEAKQAKAVSLSKDLRPMTNSMDDLNRAKTLETNLKNKVSEIVKAIKEAGQAGNCSHCGQPMPADKIAEHVESLKTQAREVKEGLVKLADKIVSYPADLSEKIENVRSSLDELNSEINTANSHKNYLAGRLKDLNLKKLNASNAESWAKEEGELKTIEEEMEINNKKVEEISVKIKSAEVIAATLRDDGVKAKIVEDFLPFINDRLNYYLDKMNLFVNIELNNEFELKMNAPDRRGQTIHDLSTGQQRRIDLATLMAWRDVAKLASACDSNLLVLDEILENLSAQGVEEFLEMWRLIDEDVSVCMYTITQRVTDFEPLFDSSIIYALKDDATYIHQES